MLTPEQLVAFNWAMLRCLGKSLDESFEPIFTAGVAHGRAEQRKADAQISRECGGETHSATWQDACECVAVKIESPTSPSATITEEHR